jgi:gamma-glutamylcyclotransferase (GGCT)/AIG2-like uncharacterized protein YtfP
VALLNFAYGTNMLSARLRQRVPGARLIGAASLRGHALRWHKVATDGSGKCDIMATEPDSVVHGVLYVIPPHEKMHLDRAEGLGYGYEEMDVQVECRTQMLKATAYVATRVDESILPIAYVNELRSIDAKLDADAQRHAHHMALAAHR